MDSVNNNLNFSCRLSKRNKRNFRSVCKTKINLDEIHLNGPVVSWFQNIKNSIILWPHLISPHLSVGPLAIPPVKMNYPKEFEQKMQGQMYYGEMGFEQSPRCPRKRCSYTMIYTMVYSPLTC